MLDLFCGRGGWTNAFLERGWDVYGVDLMCHPEYRGKFIKANVLEISAWTPYALKADCICASSPCEKFSVHGMKHFFPNPPHPESGIELFEHTRRLCEDSGLPWVMENVRAAQQFVGRAVNHCGPFYLWGNLVPPLLPEGINKGLNMGRDPVTGKRTLHLGRRSSHNSKMRTKDKAVTATIPSELAHCVAEYAERILGL